MKKVHWVLKTLDDEKGVSLVANELGLCNLRKMPCRGEIVTWLGRKL